MKIQGIIILKRASPWNYLLPWKESEWETVDHSPGHMGGTWCVPCNLSLGSPDVQDWFHAPLGEAQALQTLSCAFCIAQGGRRTHGLCVGLGWVGLGDAQSRLILITDIFMGFVSSLCTLVGTRLPGFESWLHHLPTITWAHYLLNLLCSCFIWK